MIVVYEQFGIAYNLGHGAWTTIRKVNLTDPESQEKVVGYGIAFDYLTPGHAMPYPSEEERNAHWDKIIGILRSMVGANPIIPATKIPSVQDIMNPRLERR